MGQQHGRWPVNCSGVATTRYICSIVLECVHPRGPHSYHDFSKRARPENVADIVLLFSCSLTAVAQRPFGSRARTSRCRCADSISIDGYALSTFRWFLRSSGKWICRV